MNRWAAMHVIDRFLMKYGRYIPRNLIPGLPDELPDFANAISTSPSCLDLFGLPQRSSS
jgi:hypothetical protein